VELAAKALNCELARIGKTLSFMINGQSILVLTADDAKIDNAKCKARFGTKAKMLSPDETLELIGHAVGGVCPFGINEGVDVYLDISLKRFSTVFPVCGSVHKNKASRNIPRSLFSTRLNYFGNLVVTIMTDQCKSYCQARHP
jgi:prolyl-tRNA editing enzyme YbaK/EbsC (Cys-tRNA(Pro) deacylase)